MSNQENNQKEYNHNLKDVAEACGIGAERADELVDQMNNKFRHSESFSEFVEKLENNFTKRELAFVLMVSNRDMRMSEMDDKVDRAFRRMMKDIFRS